MRLETILTLGKSLAIKREKADDDSEQTFAHLKFTDLLVRREEVTDLCAQRAGWCETSFFDELGAPLGAWTLVLHKTNFTVTGSIAGPGGKDKMNLVEATLDSIEVTFTKLGAVVSGQPAKPAATRPSRQAELRAEPCAQQEPLNDDIPFMWALAVPVAGLLAAAIHAAATVPGLAA